MERWSIGLFVLGTLFAVFIGGLLHWYGAPMVGAMIAIPGWIICRTVDFMAGGPARRKRAAKAR